MTCWLSGERLLPFVLLVYSSVWVAEWPLFWERAAHSVDYMLSYIHFDYLNFFLVISRFGFGGGSLVLLVIAYLLLIWLFCS